MSHTDHHVRGNGNLARVLANEGRKRSGAAGKHAQGPRRQRTRRDALRAALRAEQG